MRYCVEQMEYLDRLKPEQVTAEVKFRLEILEKDLLELKRQQTEIVEQSVRVMFEISSVVEQTKVTLCDPNPKAKLESYQRALEAKQQKRL